MCIYNLQIIDLRYTQAPDVKNISFWNNKITDDPLHYNDNYR